MKSFVKATLLLSMLLAMAMADGCWKNTQGRGVGVPTSSCNPGTEKNGALCYPLCKAGYNGVGPVCWGPGLPYGRTAGTVLVCAPG